MSNHIPPLPSAFHEQPEWLRVTLSCIGDGVITTDNRGHVTFLNPVAEALTGWSLADAAGLKLESVFHIVNETTRSIVENPVHRALREGVVVGLANHTLLIAKDGTERPIDDSAAPIRSDSGDVAGVVLIFRDVTERKRDEQLAHDALAYADNIIATMREPFLVLDHTLRVVTANESFYENFHVAQSETQGQFVYDLGNRQWDIPALRTLLEEVLPENHVFQDFEVEHDFPNLGRKTMLLNARRIRRPGNHSELILLAIEDVTERRLAEQLARDTLAYADNIIDTLRVPFLVLDQNLRIVSSNGSFYRNFEVTQAETLGQYVYDLGNRQWDIPQLRTLLEEVLPQNQIFLDFEVVHDFPTLGRKTMLLNARRIRRPGNHSELILLAIEDVTERKLAEAELSEHEQRFRVMIDALPAAIYMTDAAGVLTHFNPACVPLSGRTPVLHEDRWCVCWKLFLADGTPVPHEDCSMAMALKGDCVIQGLEAIAERPDGTRVWCVAYPSVIRDLQGQIIGGMNMLIDITDRKQAEVTLKLQNERLRLLGEAAETLLFADDPEAMLHSLIEEISSHLGVDSYRNHLVDESGVFLRLASYGGISEEIALKLQRLRFGESIGGTSALLRQSIVVSDMQQSNEPIYALAKSSGCRAFACYPLLTDDQLLGTLSFGSQTKDEFYPEELIFLQTIAHYVAVAYSQLRARNLMQSSEERQKLILDTMPQMVTTALPNGDVNYFNPQWFEYTGLTFKQIKDWGWKQFIHPDDLEETVRIWTHCLQTGEMYHREHRFRRADGVYHWFEGRLMPIRDAQGIIVLWIGSNTDIDEMKQAEASIHDSEVRYRRLFEAAHDGILILDSANRKITHVNPFLTTLLDYPVEHFVGKELWQIGILGDKQASQAAMQQLDEQGSLRYENLPLQDRQGHDHPVEMVANVYAEGPLQVIQCNVRDISDRVRLEELLRTQSVEMSDLHRRKDEFLAMLSHELRSPLAPIANAVQLLGLQSETETLIHKKARDIIQRQLGQLQHLVDDLLEVSRITTGRVQLRRERVTVNRIVQGAVETTRPLIEQQGHTLTVTILPPPIWLDADPARLEQVVVNLLTNAAKYTEAGGQIHLTAQIEGPECVLRVRDNGVGISPTLLPRIFDLFTQADRSLARSDGGLGIGLALVQRLTELHGGTVEVQSVLGHGSEFIVRLPLYNEAPRAAAGSVDGGVDSPHAPLPPPLRVLVVDDNVDTVLSFSMLLQALGHEVRTAYDGVSAVQAALDYRPEVMLLDIGLPGLSGYEVAKRVREQPQLRDVVLVALTGYGQDSDRATSLQAGFNHHMVKPASFEQIKKILASVPRLPR